jgi:hypothetical protein
MMPQKFGAPSQVPRKTQSAYSHNNVLVIIELEYVMI